MTTMREKMARAMHDRMNGRFGTASDWERAEEFLRQKFLDYADAALAALEEPTEGMKRAGADKLYEFGPEAYLAGYNEDGDDAKELRREYGSEWGAVIEPFTAMLRAAREGK